LKRSLNVSGDWNSVAMGVPEWKRAADIFSLLERKILEQTRQVKGLIS